MLKSQFDPNKPLRYFRYGRMSTDQQNVRSPEQQFDAIERVLKQKGYPWVHVGDYRDDGISGRKMLGRPGLQRMLAKVEPLKVDLVLVHTYERIGRNDEVPALIRRLSVEHGVLLLTADSGFADPTTMQGKVYGVIENLRATMENSVKSEHVLRGRRDAAQRKHWPGGPAPLGYRLESVFREGPGPAEIDYRRLVPDPHTAWIVQQAFQTARDHGLGSNRLARCLNELPNFPAGLKKFQPATVWRMLANPIYRGEYVFGKVSRDIIDDVHVTRKNAEEDLVVVPDFCAPIVDPKLWWEVDAIRRERSHRLQAARARNADAGPRKQIEPLLKGAPIKYPLAGLPVCTVCGRAMHASSSPTFTTKSGAKRRYVHYHCPGNTTEMCPNDVRVPEDWLFQQVVQAVLDRFFVGPPAS